jgi:hypothetical protein
VVRESFWRFWENSSGLESWVKGGPGSVEKVEPRDGASKKLLLGAFEWRGFTRIDAFTGRGTRMRLKT